MKAFLAIVRQTITVSFRSGGGPLVGLIFFLSVVIVVPFGVGPDLNLLSRIGPAIIWIGALLATLLGLDRLFQDDRDDGSLDQLQMAGLPLEFVVLAKAAGHWIATGLPLVIAAPVFGLFLNLSTAAMGVLVLTLLVGTPALTLIGVIGGALMVAIRRGGMLVAVLVLPFAIPVLIFGVLAVSAIVVGPADSFGLPFMLLCATTLLAIVVGPVAGAGAIRAGRE
ncbi:MAG: heme exporter protein CcmB [Bauldia sp.]|nr:heme exporter protein CcmB [Bauldia sp.]